MNSRERVLAAIRHEPTAKMEIAEIKAQYGDRLCLWGNIDLNHVTTYASPEEVRNVVKDTISVAAPDGGYILSTCNVMVDCIPSKNVLAMMEVGEEHQEGEQGNE